jgi:two-component system NarL family sensor kinase
MPPPPEAQTRLKALQARVVTASEEARHIAYELHPSVLDDLGLVASLRALCNALPARDKDISVKFSSSALPPSIPRETASCVYRIAQQSLDNVIKHANAKHVSVTLGTRRGTLTLNVADDGEGFDVEAVKGRGGLGFVGMEERARLSHGKLAIEGHPGAGTRIALEVPLRANNP